MTLIPLRLHPDLSEAATQWFHSKFGVPLDAYRESIAACVRQQTGIPQWYLLTEGDEIVGGLGAIENDFHLRPDLTPNVCALYVEEAYRRRGLARKMLNFVCEDLAQMGFPTVYLLTDHTAFYEKCGWEFFCMVQENSGEFCRVYRHTT